MLSSKNMQNKIDINRGINSLDEYSKRVFDGLLLDFLYDRHWCKEHGFDYSRLPEENIQMAKEIVYIEYFLPHFKQSEQRK